MKRNKLYYENRIALLKERGTENARIIAKLKRKIRLLEEAEDNCAVMATKELMDYLENGNIKNSVNFPECSLGPVQGTRICVLNKNIPAMLSAITGAISNLGLNIANLLNKSKGDYACTMVDIDGDVDEAHLAEVLAIPGIIRIRVINK